MNAADKGPTTLKPAAAGRESRIVARKTLDTVTAGLQQMFAAIADEPIPDEFLRLLDAIDAGTAKPPTDSEDCVSKRR